MVVIKNEAGINSEKSEFSPSLWQDYLVFTSEGMNNEYLDNDAQYDLYLSAITGDNSLMGRTLFSKVINTPLNESQACFYNNGFGMLLTGVTELGDPENTKHNYILQLKQSDYTDLEWSEAIVLDIFQQNLPSCHPTLNSAASLLIFAGDRPGGYGKMDLYYSERIGSHWSDPVNMGPQVNSSGNDWFPTLINDKYLVYSSDDPESGLDMYIALIEDHEVKKKAILPQPFNTSSDDFGLVCYRNGKQGYLSSNRSGGVGADDIYFFNSEKSLFSLVSEISVNLDLIVRSDNSFDLVEKAVIKLKQLDEEKVRAFDQSIFEINTNDSIISVTTDEMGKSSVKLFKGYTLLEVSHPDHQNWVKVFWNDGLDNSVDILLKKKPVEDMKNTYLEDNFLLDRHVDVGSVLVFDDIYYDYNSFEIKKGAAFELDVLMAYMKTNKDVIIELRSHTDSRGDYEYNQQLSEERAKAAKKYLVKKGIEEYRIRAIGFGEQQLRNHCHDGVICSDSEHIYNRRTEVVILAK